MRQGQAVRFLKYKRRILERIVFRLSSGCEHNSPEGY